MLNEEKASAKVNLHLRVLNQRHDGFHDILSLMAGVKFCDLLKLEFMEILGRGPGSSSVEVTVSGGISASALQPLPQEKNLVRMAALKFFERAGISGRAHFSLEKNIPLGAGLGGGSSDAAAVLRLLNNRLRLLGDEELHSLAAEIGSDVPFCLTSGLSFCEGRGEIITPIKERLSCAVLIVNDQIEVSTKWAYESLGRGMQKADEKNLSGNNLSYEKNEILKALRSGNPRELKKILRNDFEETVFLRFPRISGIKKRVLDLGAEFALMTGSGSSVAGLFFDRKRANEAVLILKKEAANIILTEFQ